VPCYLAVNKVVYTRKHDKGSFPVDNDRVSDVAHSPCPPDRFCLMTWFRPVRILSVDGACLSLATIVVPSPVKTILELFRPAFEVLPKAGNAEPVERGKPG